jgi:hypothetical protein
LFIPLENKNLCSRNKPEDEPAIRQTHFQERTSKDGQMPLLSPQASHLQTKIIDQRSLFDIFKKEKPDGVKPDEWAR